MAPARMIDAAPSDRIVHTEAVASRPHRLSAERKASFVAPSTMVSSAMAAANATSLRNVQLRRRDARGARAACAADSSGNAAVAIASGVLSVG